MEETVSILEKVASSSPTIAGLVLVVLGCYFIYVRFGKCVNCEIVKEKDEYKTLFNGSVSHLETSVELNKEIRQEMESVKTELSEHKQIMQDIAKTQRETSLILET